MTLPLPVFLSEFYVEKSNAKKAKAIRYTEGKIDYYMCVENAGKVLLRVSYVINITNAVHAQATKVIDHLKG